MHASNQSDGHAAPPLKRSSGQPVVIHSTTLPHTKPEATLFSCRVTQNGSLPLCQSPSSLQRREVAFYSSHFTPDASTSLINKFFQPVVVSISHCLLSLLSSFPCSAFYPRPPTLRSLSVVAGAPSCLTSSMPASQFSNSESDYADDVFSDHSDENTDGTEETDSEDSDDSDDSDAEISEDDKLPPPEHYEAEETTLNVKQLRQRRLKKTTVDNMDRVQDHWHQYCEYMRRRDVLDAYWTLSIQSLKGFLSWACDQCCSKGGRRQLRIQVISSLETF
ncbi:hypothetical protein I7I48_05403 [Histoplasma ohiense]|nr:hypothetical protein I7I48_05403 [Histoplasma ohiense (nom. inval.)]